MTVEDWAEIRRLYVQEQMSIRAIGKRLGIARDTVSRAVCPGAGGVAVRCP